MKKVLFATTALVATAGVAAADVTFGGYGRFGIMYNDNDSTTGDSSTDVTSRFRLQIDATAESDAGVVFGARTRIQQNNTDNGNDPAGSDLNGVRFFARTGGFEVGVGNIFGALESMPGQYPVDMGLTGLGYDYTAFNDRGDQYSSSGSGAAGANGLEVLYSAGDLAVHVSASDDNDRVAGYVAYTWSGWTFAV
ncbi:porin, partial [Marinobacter sp.]